MQQYQVRILADQEEAERIATLMEAAFEEEGPVSWFEHDGAWAIDGWFFAESAEALEARVRDCLGSDAFGAPLTVTEVPQDVDWVALSLEGLKPVVAGDFVVFGAHDKDNVDPKLIGLQIEANQAFGTGHHPTTWGCLEALSELLGTMSFKRVLDLGSGSGVLAIAVAKKTGRVVLASDNDPIAVEIAAENAEINGVKGLIDAIVAEGFEHADLKAAPFDLIVANILA
ncbi:50S ribosomal protein L11 methyltransferase, partial [Oryzibacter oryziterrae]|uniref:50S ribosomal protein L11 methyltransferase n=1 Tax=Oryzibacter oryziterrae TaxID=2766474 RepID=UPI001F31D609